MAEQLKNNYNRRYINRLASSLAAVHPAFPIEDFTQNVLDKTWKNRELKDRMHHITRCLHESLALPYTKAIKVLCEVCDDFGGFEGMLFPDYVEQYGQNSWRASIKALEIFTQASSSEFAVRPFIELAPEKMMQQMLKWSEHDNEHVRRLASEGCRPRLPWANALPLFKKNPDPIFPILDNLKADPSLYVRKSVANNLNDISKDNPDKVLKWCRKNIGSHPHTDWIIKKACRSLLKNSHPEALRLFSYPDASKTQISSFTLNKSKLFIGESIQLSVKARHLSPGPLRIEYAMHFPRKNNKTTYKRFHWLDREHNESQIALTKSHPMKQLSTRTLLPGAYKVEVLVNGLSKASKRFTLEAK